MSSCCRVHGDYENINGDMVAPSKVGKCCGRTYLCMKENGGAITQVALLALAMVAAGVATYLYYNLKADPIEEGNVLFPGTLSVYGALFFFSTIFEGIYVCKYPQEKRRMPSPCLQLAGGIVVALGVAYVQFRAAEKLENDHINHSLVPHRVDQVLESDSIPTWIISACASCVVAAAYEGVIHLCCPPKRAGRDAQALLIAETPY